MSVSEAKSRKLLHLRSCQPQRSGLLYIEHLHCWAAGVDLQQSRHLHSLEHLIRSGILSARNFLFIYSSMCL